MNTHKLFRLAGVSAVIAGVCFLVIGLFHSVNEPSQVNATWVNVHIFATALGFFGILGMTGLYVRQAEKSGWLGLIGFFLFAIWMTLVSGFSFVEAFILPIMLTESPAFVASLLGMFSNAPSTVDLGILPTLWNISGPMFILGPVFFGIATYRARVFPHWAGALMALNAILVPIGAMAPLEYQAKIIMIPLGIAIVWLGYSLWSDRRVSAHD